MECEQPLKELAHAQYIVEVDRVDVPWPSNKPAKIMSSCSSKGGHSDSNPPEAPAAGLSMSMLVAALALPVDTSLGLPRGDAGDVAWDGDAVQA